MGGAQLSNPGSQSLIQTGGLADKTLIYEVGLANNTTTTIYTVTAGKTFYLLHAGLTAYFTAANGNRAVLWKGGVVDDGTLMYAGPSAAAGTYNRDVVYPDPLPIPASTPIKVTSWSANYTTYGYLIGWEE